ncbi:MAG: GNAT family N-acetyltransferase [Methylophilaceae bacterium]
MNPEFYIKEVTWSTHETALRLIREQVFIVEQHVPESLEWDGLDAKAIHLLAFDDQQQPIGCARLLENGSIGRMAVMPDLRGSGLGKALLDKAIMLLKKRDLKQVSLSAQIQAISFYEKSGFTVCSKPYLDASILHVDMQLII